MEARFLLNFGVFLIIVQHEARCDPKFRLNPDCECGEAGHGIQTRVIGGTRSLPHMFPWITGIFLNDFFHCGGTLINDRYILTAGHCVNGTDIKSLSIRLGAYDLENQEEGCTVPIEKILLHENFSKDFLHDICDLALIKMAYPVQLAHNIRTVCLPEKGSNYANRIAKVAGWGFDGRGGAYSRFLRETELRVMPSEECVNTLIGNHITRSMICAYDIGSDACKGDSGGPLLLERDDRRYEIIGVVSWGIGCANKGFPGVYVKIADYLNWIQNHTKDGIYCINKVSN